MVSLSTHQTPNQTEPPSASLDQEVRPLEIAPSPSPAADDDDDSFRDEAPCGEIPIPLLLRGIALSKARRLLYVSWFCYHASELFWVFGSALWLAALSDYSSLFWSSAYQATAKVLVVVVVPVLSSKIVHVNRSTLVSAWIIGQHVCVMVTTALIFGTLKLRRQTQGDNAAGEETETEINHSNNNNNNNNINININNNSQIYLARIGLVLICFCGGFAQVFHNVLQVAIERDWIVIMAEEAQKISASTKGTIDASSSSSLSSSPSWLQDTNVALKQIYLVCQILGPLVMGCLLARNGDSAGIGVVFGLKSGSMVVVYACMHRLYRQIPLLHDTNRQSLSPSPSVSPAPEQQDHHHKHNANNEDAVSGRLLQASTIDGDNDDEEESSPKLSSESDPSRCHFSVYSCCSLFDSRWCSDLQTYCSQSKQLVGAGIGLALLYSNVLTFGGMMIAYLVEKGGMSTASIGLWEGLSSGAAVVGTVWFSHSRLDLASKALWSLVILFACLSLSMIGVGVGRFGDCDDRGLGSALVIAGVLLSRIGLWGYDLGVTQLFQTGVEPSLRGTVGGTQTILNNAVQCVPLALGMVFSKVDDFWIVMVTGYAGVGAALLSYGLGTYCLPHYKRVPAVFRDDDKRGVFKDNDNDDGHCCPKETLRNVH